MKKNTLDLAELPVRSFQALVEFGIEGLELWVDITPSESNMSVSFRFSAGIDDEGAVAALKSLVDRIEADGLPEIAFGYHGRRPN